MKKFVSKFKNQNILRRIDKRTNENDYIFLVCQPTYQDYENHEGCKELFEIHYPNHSLVKKVHEEYRGVIYLMQSSQNY